MWPFTRREKTMNYRMIDSDFAVAGQITPAEVRDIAAAGFRSILCARPDGEDHGQPAFSEIERAAAENGLTAIQIPISGSIGEGAIIRMGDALKAMPKPMFGYCRSGGRAGSLYAAALKAAR